jgi:hypothetical protein
MSGRIVIPERLYALTINVADEPEDYGLATSDSQKTASAAGLSALLRFSTGEVGYLRAVRRSTFVEVAIFEDKRSATAGGSNDWMSSRR